MRAKERYREKERERERERVWELKRDIERAKEREREYVLFLAQLMEPLKNNIVVYHVSKTISLPYSHYIYPNKLLIFPGCEQEIYIYTCRLANALFSNSA